MDQYVAAQSIAAGDASSRPYNRDASVKVIGELVIRRVFVALPDLRAGPNDNVGVDDSRIDQCPRADPGIVEYNRLSHDSARRYIDAGGQHRMLNCSPDDASIGDQAIDYLALRTDFYGRSFLVTRADDPIWIIQVQGRDWLRHLEVGFPVGVNGSDVYPVTLKGVSVGAALADHTGDHVFAEIEVGDF